MGGGTGLHASSSRWLRGQSLYRGWRTSSRTDPLERERLMGMPDGHTNIPWEGKPRTLDVARFRAIGNSLAIPDVRWLGERIKLARAMHYGVGNLRMAA